MLLIEDRLDAARSHLSSGREESAALIYESILEISPRNVTALKGLAASKLGKGDLKAAHKLATEAVAWSTNDTGALCLLAQIAMLGEQHDQALAAIDQALAAEPFHPEACRIKAGLLMQQDDPRTAERLLSDALARHPTDDSLPAALSQIYMEHGLPAPALELSQKALALSPDRPEFIALVSAQLAALGDHEKALGLIERAHLMEPGNALYMVRLADVLAALGQLTEAKRIAKRVVGLYPHLLSGWSSYAKVMIYRGEGEAGLAELVATARRHPDRIGALITLAAAYRIAGEPAQALRLIEPVLAQATPLGSIQRAQAITLVRDCYLSLGFYEKAAATFSRPELYAALGLPTNSPSAEIAAENPPLSDEERTNQKPDAELIAAFSGASLIVDRGLSNLEALALLRFKPKRARKVNVHGPSGLAQIAELIRHVRFRADDQPGGPQADGAAVAIPLSSIFAFPPTIRGGIAESVPYMQAPPGRLKLWAGSLQKLPRPLVALAWDGTRPGILLEDYRGIFEGFDGTLVSVMWDETRHQLATWPSIIDAGVHFTSLADLAAVIAESDAVIGPDGIPMHVAGAMGRPAALLSFPSTTWYWYEQGGTSVWYPSVSVLKTNAFGNWGNILPELSPKIASFLETLDRTVANSTIRAAGGSA
ncbi:tetratricopeptide repeat protein [Mesorhizobium sp. PL10]